eukprot:c953_g1_i1.p1 GENE.c953_g1_i1~~c953_g1_i1.p1  ORF type:complete len:514 (+),score=97.52 c953_g1_i1:102-1643(+)
MQDCEYKAAPQTELPNLHVRYIIFGLLCVVVVGTVVLSDGGLLRPQARQQTNTKYFVAPFFRSPLQDSDAQQRDRHEIGGREITNVVPLSPDSPNPSKLQQLMSFGPRFGPGKAAQHPPRPNPDSKPNKSLLSRMRTFSGIFRRRFSHQQEANSFPNSHVIAFEATTILDQPSPSFDQQRMKRDSVELANLLTTAFFPLRFDQPHESVILSSATHTVIDAKGRPLQAPDLFECEGLRFQFVSDHSCNLKKDGDSCKACYTSTLSNHPNAAQDDVVAKLMPTTQMDLQSTTPVVGKWGWSSAPGSPQLLQHEAQVLSVLNEAQVPHIVQFVAYCAMDESNMQALMLSNVPGEPIEPFDTSGYWLALANPFLQNVSPTVLEKEKVLIRESLEAAIAMLSAGVVHLSDRSMVIDKATGHITFVDFGRADILNELGRNAATCAVVRFLTRVFTMVPERHEEWVESTLQGLLEVYPPPQHATESLITNLWKFRLAPSMVIDDWLQHNGVDGAGWADKK